MSGTAPSNILARSGKLGRITIGGTIYALNKWDVDPEAEIGETTNFESGGYYQDDVGILKATGTAGGLWNARTNYFDSPPGIVAGALLSTIVFYISTVDNVFWSFPLLRVVGTPQTSEIKGWVSFSFKWNSFGSWAYPTGSVSS